jgi:hypothetical protein
MALRVSSDFDHAPPKPTLSQVKVSSVDSAVASEHGRLSGHLDTSSNLIFDMNFPMNYTTPTKKDKPVQVAAEIEQAPILGLGLPRSAKKSSPIGVKRTRLLKARSTTSASSSIYDLFDEDNKDNEMDTETENDGDMAHVSDA